MPGTTGTNTKAELAEITCQVTLPNNSAISCKDSFPNLRRDTIS